MALDSEIDTLRGYFAKLCGTEHAKNQLFEDLLTRLEAQNHELQQEKLDHTRESHFNREVQLRERKLLDELRLAKARIERDAFILVLIDGDGMIFEDHYIQGGEEGGKEAASMLWGAVRDYVHQNIPGLPSDYKIVARVYANLNGLSDACNKAGIIDNPHLMREFARGFTGTKQLFDFIDVGSGKDRADDKVSELLKLYLYNCHCRHILFGCSHDNGYARLLEDVNDRTMPNHITLLEGVPFERELAAMKSRYVTTKFENLFRTTKINVYQQYQQPPQVRPPLSQPQSMPQLLPTQTQMQPSLLDGVHNGLQNGLQSLQIANSSQTPQQVPYQSQYQPAMDRTPSASTNNSAMNPMATTWANKAVAAAPPQLASPPPTPQPADNGNKIPRNRLGQRIDPVIQYDRSEFKRVQKIHMCNIHFLRNDCPYGEDCTHDHSYKPNKNEILTLRYVSRQTPCRFGAVCDDIKCIYGHRCPTAIDGSKECRFGPNCRFDPSLHGIDLQVVRTTKVS